MSPINNKVEENSIYLDSCAPFEEALEKVTVHCKERIDKAEDKILLQGKS